VVHVRALRDGPTHVPVRLTLVVAVVTPAEEVGALVEELLEIVMVPVAVPVAVGLNWTVSVAVLPGFRVSGKVAPETVKPVPLTVTELMVTGAVPVELRVSDWVVALFSATLPKAMVLALTASVGVPAPNCRA